MSSAAWVVVVAAALLALGVVVWFLTARKAPQTQPGRRYIVDRPGGPGAESQLVEEPGSLETGPVRPGRPPSDGA